MSTKPPEPSPAQIDQWWAEALDRHAVNPRPAFMQLARLAHAAGWEARATSQLSLGVDESFPPGDDEIKAWADSCDCVPPETLVDEDDWDDGYGLIFRPAQFYETVRAALARWGRPVPPADPIRAALERLVIMASNELASGQLVYSQPEWNDAIAAARAALNAAPSDEPAVPEGREPAAVAGEPSDEELAPAGRVGKRAWPPSVAAGCHEAAIAAASGSPEQQLLAAAGNTIENLWNELHRTITVQLVPAPDGEAGPSDDDLALVYHDCCGGCDLMDQVGFEDAARAVLARWGRPVPPADPIRAALEASPEGKANVGSEIWREAVANSDSDDECRSFQRGAEWALTRWGRPVQPPAAGEARALVAWLRRHVSAQEAAGTHWAGQLARAADLLERQAAPVPVPVAVSEWLPQAEDCDAEGRCWVHQPHYACPESPAWELMLAKYASANYGAVCWLPAHALPLPSGEAANG